MPADDEADTEDDAADDLSAEIGRVDEDGACVQQSNRAQHGEPEHRRHDRREHHLQHAHVRKIELCGELLCIAEAGTLQHEAEAEAEDHCQGVTNEGCRV